MENIISIRDLSKKDILYILDLAKKVESSDCSSMLKGRILATLFYEPSTRTRLSFVTAMQRLGGQVTGFADPKKTSAAKGETLFDTIKMVESYSDIIAIRHPLEGAARLSSEAASIPVINAGDGANQHPTQTLLDLYTILKSKGSLDKLKVAMVGDLKYGRTVHSLACALSLFDTELSFVAPASLKMPNDLLADLTVPYKETDDLIEGIKDADIIYMTRVQKERFPDPIDYERVKGVYVLDCQVLSHCKKDAKVMHPLPRVDEIAVEVDQTDHAIYFEQAANGVIVRQALLAMLLGELK